MITPDTSFTNTTYIVNIICQLDSNSGSARLNSARQSDFTVVTYVGGAINDCLFNVLVVA